MHKSQTFSLIHRGSKYKRYLFTWNPGQNVDGQNVDNFSNICQNFVDQNVEGKNKSSQS